MKYDLVYNTDARGWEETNHSGGQGWEGHCWGWSLASVAKPQPAAVTKDGVSFNQDEMEGLYTELADVTNDSWGQWVIGSTSGPIPSGPCTSATGEDIDGWPNKLQDGLRYRTRQLNVPLNGNLRAQAANRPDEVWNHVIYSYSAIYTEAPGGDENIVRITTTVHSNTDSNSPAGLPPDGAYRTDVYVYDLTFAHDGAIPASGHNWISCSYYPPACLGVVDGQNFVWQAKNPSVTKGNVDALYTP